MEQGTREGTRHVKKMADQMEGAANLARNALLGVAGAIGAGSFAAAIKSAVNYQDELGKLAQKSGVSVEAMSSLGHAAGLSGVSMDGLGTGLKQLSKNMLDAQAGSGDAKSAFRALGVSVVDAAGQLKAPQQQLLEIADRFAGMQDGAGKTALAMKVFGKAGADLIPLLNQGRAGIEAATEEAHRFGIVVTTQAARRAEEFNDNLTRLTKVAQGLKIEFANALLPALTRVTEEMLEGTRIAGGYWQALNQFGTINPFRDVGGNLAALRSDLEDLHKNRGIMAGLTGYENALKALDRDIQVTENRIKFLQFQQRRDVLAGVSDKDLDARDLAARAIRDRKTEPPALPEDDKQAATEAERTARRIQEAEDEWQKIMSEASAFTAAFRDQELAAQRAFEESRITALIEAYEREQELAFEQGQALLSGSGMAYTVRLEELRRQFMTEEEIAAEEFELKMARIAEFSDAELAQFGGYAAIREALEAQHQAKLGNAAAKGIMDRLKLEKMTAGQQAQFYFGHLAQITAGAAQHNKTMFELNKMAGIANAIISANEGAAQALKWGWPLGPIFAGVIWGAAAANIAAIRATQFGGTSSAPSIGGGAAIPVYNANPAPIERAPEVDPPTSTRGREQQRRQVNITFVGGEDRRYSYQEVRDEIIPLINEAIGDGVDLNVRAAYA